MVVGFFFHFFDPHFVVFSKGGYANGHNPRRPASQSAGGWEAKNGDSEDNWRGTAQTFVRQSSNREGGPYGVGSSKRGRRGVEYGASTRGVEYGASTRGVEYGASTRGVEYGASTRGVGNRSTHNHSKSWRIGPCFFALLETLPPPPSSPPVGSGPNRRPSWAKHNRSGKIPPCSSKNLPHTHNVLVRCSHGAVRKSHGAVRKKSRGSEKKSL